MPVAAPITEDFDELTLPQALSLIQPSAEAAANRPYIEGDHLQDGKAWVGIGPKKDDPRYMDFIVYLKDNFTFKNVLRQGCGRLTGAVIGWEPYWAWVPMRQNTTDVEVAEGEKAQIIEMEQAQTNWWDKRKVHKQLKKMCFFALWAKEICWRLFTPSGLIGEDGSVTVSTLDEAFDLIFLEIPDPEDASVWEHPDTKDRIGVVRFKDATGAQRVEITYLVADDTGEKTQTVIKILPALTDGLSESTNDFGGHLPVYQVSLEEPLINGDARALQRSYNATLTLLQKNLTDNQFLERFFMGTMPPGKEVKDEEGNRIDFIPDKRETGPNVDTWLSPIDYQGKDGETKLASQGVMIRQPLDPNGTIMGAEYWYQCLLEALRQDHILINQLATPSGKSRERSRGDFIDSTKDPVMEINLAGRELLLTAACMAEAFMGAEGRWTSKFKPVFQCRPNYGPLPVAERQQNVTEAKEGFLSDQTVMSLNGTDDVDAEEALIDAQPRKQLALVTARAEALKTLELIFPREVALHMVGYTDKEIADLMKRTNAATSPDPKDIPEPTPGNAPPAAKLKTRADQRPRLKVSNGGAR